MSLLRNLTTRVSTRVAQTTAARVVSNIVSAVNSRSSVPALQTKTVVQPIPTRPTSSVVSSRSVTTVTPPKQNVVPTLTSVKTRVSSPPTPQPVSLPSRRQTSSSRKIPTAVPVQQQKERFIRAIKKPGFDLDERLLYDPKQRKTVRHVIPVKKF